MPETIRMAFAVACLLLSLLLQALPFLHMGSRPGTLIHTGSALMLGYLSWASIPAGHDVTALILLAAGVTQLLLSSSVIDIWGKLNLPRVTAAALGLGTGMILIFSDTAPSGRNGSDYDIALALLFLTLSLIGFISIFRPSTGFAALLFRMQAAPWLILCLMLYLQASSSIVVPLVLAMFILLSGRVPWDRLVATRYDIFGRRVLVITGALEVTGLLFIGSWPVILNASTTEATVQPFALPLLIIVSALLYIEIATIIITVNTFTSELGNVTKDMEVSGTSSSPAATNDGLSGQFGALGILRDDIRVRFNALADQIHLLSRQLSTEKNRNAQLILLNELSQQLENQLDQPVSAQLAVNTLERALGCSLVTLFIHEEKNELMLLAAAGPQTSIIPPGYRQDISTGAIGRAVRQRKTQVINDIEVDRDYLRFEHEKSSSCVIVPMIFNGHINGILMLNHEKPGGFGSVEIGLAEAVAEEITRAWERSGYHQRLMNLVQSGSQLSSVMEPESTALEVASITRQILDARFAFVQIQLGQESNFTQTASSGEATKLLNSLEGAGFTEPLIQAAFHAAQPFRVRDVRKYAASKLEIDHAGLRSMMAIPIRWHRLSIGAILAFGKQNEVFFTENDEALAELLSVQAAAAFESAWLQQELRVSLTTTSLLYRLSTQIIEAENLHEAATDIAQTAHKLAKGISTGIILFSSRQQIEAEVQIHESEPRSGLDHPMEMITQVMNSGQLIYISQGQSQMRACLPIQTPIRKYGVLWINIPEGHPHKPANPADLQTLANQAALALERSLLLVESRQQAEEIKNAYYMLETTYDQTLASLISALDARDSETEGHSLRVSQLVSELGSTLGFSREQLKVLERGSLLHDIGKIGISDSILHKPGTLSEDEWKIMRQHPDIGAHIVEGIPFLQETIPLIRHHQERWNGTGYPHGLRGEEIPELARIFAVVDAYDALTNDRPYRKKISSEEALQYLRTHAGVLFDPAIVDVFEKLLLENKASVRIPE
jgi:putative nucleotidyltransferase with HDIG domain